MSYSQEIYDAARSRISPMDGSATHTPGPWTLTHRGGSNFAVQTFEIRGMFGESPNIYPIFNKNTSGIDGALVHISPENARLIAAAPELLDALEGLLVFAEAAETKMLVGDEGCLWPTEIARAAIAKARGA